MDRLVDPIILRCCRDWPCHLLEAVHFGGRCGICREVPKVVHEKYRKSEDSVLLTRHDPAVDGEEDQ